MMKETKIFLPVLMAMFIFGCSNNQNMPLVFGQTQSVGITIGTSATDQGADFSLGYKDKNIAIIPVTVLDSKTGSPGLIQSEIESKEKTKGDSGAATNSNGKTRDALSVIGQFEVKTTTGAGDVGLGKFFATGTAAQELATGFREKMAASSTSSSSAASK